MFPSNDAPEKARCKICDKVCYTSIAWDIGTKLPEFNQLGELIPVIKKGKYDDKMIDYILCHECGFKLRHNEKLNWISYDDDPLKFRRAVNKAIKARKK
jgi:hypothetical protein